MSTTDQTTTGQPTDAPTTSEHTTPGLLAPVEPFLLFGDTTEPQWLVPVEALPRDFYGGHGCAQIEIEDDHVVHRMGRDEEHYTPAEARAVAAAYLAAANRLDEHAAHRAAASLHGDAAHREVTA